MGFSRQEYWSGLPFPSAGDLLNLGIQPASPASAGGFFITEPPGMPGYPGSIPSWGTKISQVVVLSASPGCTVCVRVRVRVCVCACVCRGLCGMPMNSTRGPQHPRISGSGERPLPTGTRISYLQECYFWVWLGFSLDQ